MLKCEKVFKYFFHDCLKVFLSNLSSLTTQGSLKNDEFFVEKKKTKQKKLYINTALPSTGTSLISNLYHCVKSVQKYRVISGPYFPIFGLNAEIFHANLCIQSEYRKIRTRNNSVFGHFSHCGYLLKFITLKYLLSCYLRITLMINQGTREGNASIVFKNVAGILKLLANI